MYQPLKTIIGRLANIGAQPTDTDKERLHKQFLIYVALLMNGGGLMWASICIFFGLHFQAAVPLGYILLTVVNLLYFSRSGHFEVVRFFQLFISLVLPFVFQWSLHGFFPSGAVMLWAMTAILGALTFQNTEITLRWFFAYLVLTVFSGFIDKFVAPDSPTMSSSANSALFVVNIIGVSVVVFGLMIYFVRSREAAYAELAEMNAALVHSQAQLIQAEKMVSLGTLTAGIAHEVNTPIGVINSNVDVSERCLAKIMDALKRFRITDELEGDNQFLRSVQALHKTNQTTMECSNRISKLIDSLKNFSRLDEAASQKVDLHEGIDSALNLIQHELKGRIDVVKEYGDLPPITCQVSELNQVFMNILRNAADSIEGRGQITIRSSATPGQVTVRIEDTGVGIAPDKVRHVFDPVFTRKGPRVRAKLGLFSSHQIIQKHEGEIKIESELGKGTAVTVVLDSSS